MQAWVQAFKKGGELEVVGTPEYNVLSRTNSIVHMVVSYLME